GAGRPLGAAGSSPAGAIGGGAAAGRRPARAGAVRQRGGLGRAPLGPDAGRSRPRPAVVAPQPDRVRGPRGSPPGRPGRGGAPHPGPRPGAGLASRAAQLLTRSRARDPLALTHEVDDTLATLVQPSSLRGVLVEHPRVPMSAVLAPPVVLRPLERLVLLCENHARVEAPGGRVGVKALLSGPSGTGKTMAARALAHVLRRPLHRIDLAAVMSRWVGETEKSLRDALATAEATG